ncbi:MAG: glucosaminidase domain-containing protein [Deltaproteobacteria bacterium]|nr:glucosaminidase domain-containing protein [Deltaproteobacteria bacterium]
MSSTVLSLVISYPWATQLKVDLFENQVLNNRHGFVSAKHNHTGEIVRFWQIQLKAWAMTCPDLRKKYSSMLVTGSFKSNPKFENLIKDFQIKHGIKPDGIIGTEMFRVFFSRYFFDPVNPSRNLGKKEFERRYFPLLSEAEYRRLREIKATTCLSRYKVTKRLPRSFSAKEILTNRHLYQKFEEICLDITGGNPPISVRTFLEICAKYNVDPTLALAQAILETRFGTVGIGARLRNIFNVGITDEGGTIEYKSFEEGVEAYCRLLSTKYHKRAEEFLASDCKRKDGWGRYATDKLYAKKIHILVSKIRSHLLSNDNQKFNQNNNLSEGKKGRLVLL